MELKKLENTMAEEKNVTAQVESSENVMGNRSNTEDVIAKKGKINISPRTRKVLTGVGIFLTVILVLLGVTGAVAFAAYKKIGPVAQETANSARQIAVQIQAKNLEGAKVELIKTEEGLTKLKKETSTFSFVSFIPFAGSYFKDAQAAMLAAEHGLEAGDVFIEAVEPYADILGLKAGQGQAVKIETAEDRIVFVVQTLDAIKPKLNDISSKLELANAELAKINPNRYPTEIRGKKIRENIVLAQSSLRSAADALGEAKPLIDLLPQLLGQDGEKTYMLLFQNDGEIRPTGGFMTAYSYIKVLKGKITPLDSYDIYDLDNRWGKKLPAPEPIKKYLPLVNNWNLRDMNLSPDFKVSMDTFMSNYNDIPGVTRIDGIIALDTEIPVQMLKILGPIGVGGWGNFSAENDQRCNCPQVVYVLEDMITKPVSTLRTDRKAVLGPLMHSLMQNAMGSPKSLWPQFLNMGLSMIKQKHIMFYFVDGNNQKLAEEMNAAGRIVDFDGDYLHINDSNFGGAKSNLFITQKVDEEIELGNDGSVNKTVTITFNNPAPASNCNLEAGKLCLNGLYRDWVRLYVPKGAKLTEVIGSEVAAVTSEDLGKTVFEAFFTMRPQSSSKLVFKYTLPSKSGSTYKYLIQKQPGKDTVIHDIVLNGKPHTVEIPSDTKIEL